MNGLQAFVSICLIAVVAVIAALAISEHSDRRHTSAMLMWFVLVTFTVFGILLIVIFGIAPELPTPPHYPAQ